MRNWKLFGIVIQAFLVVVIIFGFADFFDRTTIFGLHDERIQLAAWFLLGLVQIIDTILNLIFIKKYQELYNRRWHSTYLVAVILPFLIGGLGHLLHIQELQEIVFYDMVVLLFTSPIMATAVFVQMVKEYNKLTFNNSLDHGNE